MNNNYMVTALANGMRLVCLDDGGLVSYIGIAVGAGSRDEGPHEGLAHFVEHTIFKGTGRRRSWQIASRMETVGGELNAYTSKEETLIYTTAPSGFEERAIELLGDIIAESRFPTAEIDRERDVVIEEIKSYLDSPADSVYDEYEERAYAGSPLGHNILGTPASVRQIGGGDCRAFLDNCYTPANMVMYCVGPVDCARIAKYAERYLGALHHECRRPVRVEPATVGPFDEALDRGGIQANTIMGARMFGRRDPRRFALFLLNNYLGGPCMNSRLNRELRDNRGLVYTVDSSVALFSDTGQIMIYFGSDKSTVAKCRRLVWHELDRLVQNRMPDATLERIKRQYCGQLMVSSDHKESRSMALAKSLLYYDEVHDINWTAERMRAVTADDVREVAELLDPSRFSTLTIY